MDAAEEKGIPKVTDFNKGDNFGCGYFQVTEKNGLRCSAAVGYLNPVKSRKNLKIETTTCQFCSSNAFTINNSAVLSSNHAAGGCRHVYTKNRACGAKFAILFD